MTQTTSIIQRLVINPGYTVTVTPPPKCFRCTITFVDDVGTGRGFISSSNSDLGWYFTSYFETDGVAPATSVYQGMLNAPIVMDRRGVGYMVDNFICETKGPTTNTMFFIFVWEVEI